MTSMRLRNFRKVHFVAVPGKSTNVVWAMLGDKEIGVMVIELPTRPRRPGGTMYQPPGSIRRVDVHPAYRRQGVATAMWHVAKDAGFDPNHGSQQTRDGKAWADTVGRHSQPVKHTIASRLLEWWHWSAGREW